MPSYTTTCDQSKRKSGSTLRIVPEYASKRFDRGAINDHDKRNRIRHNVLEIRTQGDPMAEPERREVIYANIDELTADIEQLAAGEVNTSGNHSFAEIVRHLATTNEMLNGQVTPPKLPWFMRLAMPFMRKSILNDPVKPGFKLPTNQMESFFWPQEPIDVPQAVTRFKASADQYKAQGPPSVHPIFGPAEPETIDAMMLSHAAMHMSFVSQA